MKFHYVSNLRFHSYVLLSLFVMTQVRENINYCLKLNLGHFFKNKQQYDKVGSFGLKANIKLDANYLASFQFNSSKFRFEKIVSHQEMKIFQRCNWFFLEENVNLYICSDHIFSCVKLKNIESSAIAKESGKYYHRFLSGQTILMVAFWLQSKIQSIF